MPCCCCCCCCCYYCYQLPWQFHARDTSWQLASHREYVTCESRVHVSLPPFPTRTPTHTYSDRQTDRWTHHGNAWVCNMWITCSRITSTISYQNTDTHTDIYRQTDRWTHHGNMWVCNMWITCSHITSIISYQNTDTHADRQTDRHIMATCEYVTCESRVHVSLPPFPTRTPTHTQTQTYTDRQTDRHNETNSSSSSSSLLRTSPVHITLTHRRMARLSWPWHDSQLNTDSQAIHLANLPIHSSTFSH